MRRVTGSVDIPLTEKGKQQARILGLRARRQDLRVFAAPNQRSMDTARRVSEHANPADWLRPWSLGEHEGKPLAGERDRINDRVVNRPGERPGVSRHSGQPGESFDEARNRLIGGVQRQKAAMQAKHTTLNITSGRALQIVHAWAANGRPEDRSVDEGEITAEKGEFSKPGQLFRLEPGGLRQIHHIQAPGQHFAQHGETEWNSGSEK